MCFILKSASQWVDSIIHTPFNFLFFPYYFYWETKSCWRTKWLVIRCLRRSLHNKITVQKLALTTKVSSCLTSVTEKFGKERFKYHWLVVQGQRGVNMGMPRSICTVGGRCYIVRARRSGLSLLSIPLLLMQPLQLLLQGISLPNTPWTCCSWVRLIPLSTCWCCFSLWHPVAASSRSSLPALWTVPF